MADKILTPEYLYQEDPASNTNKFYIACDCGDGKTALTCYGRRDAGGGNVNFHPAEKVRKKVREKYRNGYQGGDHDIVGAAVLQKITNALSTKFPGRRFDPDGRGNIILRDDTPKPPADPPRNRRQSRRKKESIHVWI